MPLSLGLSRINFDILAQDQNIKPSLAQLMEILDTIAHIKGLKIKKNKNIVFS
jgi:hypothetical protein